MRDFFTQCTKIIKSGQYLTLFSSANAKLDLYENLGS